MKIVKFSLYNLCFPKYLKMRSSNGVRATYAMYITHATNKEIGFGIFWYGLVRFGMVWYVLVWFGMVWYGTSESITSSSQYSQ